MATQTLPPPARGPAHPGRQLRVPAASRVFLHQGELRLRRATRSSRQLSAQPGTWAMTHMVRGTCSRPAHLRVTQQQREGSAPQCARGGAAAPTAVARCTALRQPPHQPGHAGAGIVALNGRHAACGRAVAGSSGAACSVGAETSAVTHDHTAVADDTGRAWTSRVTPTTAVSAALRGWIAVTPVSRNIFRPRVSGAVTPSRLQARCGTPLKDTGGQTQRNLGRRRSEHSEWLSRQGRGTE